MARKRKVAKVIKPTPSNNIEALSIDNIVLRTSNGVKFHLKRLRYRGVPKLSNDGKGKFRKSEALAHANRDDLIRNIHRLLSRNDGLITNTELTLLNSGAVSYFKYIDDNTPEINPFSFEAMESCLKHYNQLRLNGENRSAATHVQRFLSYFLDKMGEIELKRKLPDVSAFDADGRLGAYDIESELKPVAKVLIRGYTAFSSHIKNNTTPTRHPFYDEELFNRMANDEGWDKYRIGLNKSAFKKSLQVSSAAKNEGKADEDTLLKILIFNQASRCALFLFLMLTGMNDSVLKMMKRSDVSFLPIGAGRFIFNGVKGRAGYKETDNALGFSKRTKGLIEEWLLISEKIYSFMGEKSIDRLPLIPYIDPKLKIKNFSHTGYNPRDINNLITKILPFRINATRFRKTKSDILMRVTEDMYIVSQGLNNTIDVVAKSYSSGVESTHNSNVMAAMEAQASIAKGVAIDKAISDAKVLHSDILSEYDYKERLKRAEIPVTTITPSGVRCGKNKGKATKTERKNKQLNIKPSSNKCTNFLECFDCDSHILVASISDIWLMLTFKTRVDELKEISAYNSVPKDKLSKLQNILSRTLERYKSKSPDNYLSAENRFEKQGSHPLYANLKLLVNALEVM